MFLRDEKGSITIAFAILLPAFLLSAALAFDLLWLNNHRRYLQAQADMAALEAVRHVRAAETSVQKAGSSVSHNDVFEAEPPSRDQVVIGRWEDRTFTAYTSENAILPNAANVPVNSRAKTNVTALLGQGFDVPIRRAATAVALERASFSLSNCLASLNLFRSVLASLLSAELDLLCSDGALDLETDALLRALAVNLDAPMTYGDVLDAEIHLLQLWSVVLGVDVPAPPGRIRVGDILYLDEASQGLALGVALPGGRVDGSDLIFASLELLGKNVLDLDLHADLGTFASVPVSATILEPRRVVSNVEPGAPEAFAQTAQVRLSVDGLDLLGLVQLDLTVELAQASARLSGTSSLCFPEDEGSAAVLDPVTAGVATLHIELTANGLTLADQIQLLQTGDQVVRFSVADIAEQVSKTVALQLAGTLDQISNEATGLLYYFQLLALGGEVEPLLDAVVRDFVGLALAPASVRVLDAHCDIRLVQ